MKKLWIIIHNFYDLLEPPQNPQLRIFGGVFIAFPNSALSFSSKINFSPVWLKSIKTTWIHDWITQTIPLAMKYHFSHCTRLCLVRRMKILITGESNNTEIASQFSLHSLKKSVRYESWEMPISLREPAFHGPQPLRFFFSSPFRREITMSFDTPVAVNPVYPAVELHLKIHQRKDEFGFYFHHSAEPINIESIKYWIFYWEKRFQS